MQEVVNLASQLLKGIKEKGKKGFKGVLIVKHPRRYPIDKLELQYIKRVETYEFGLNSISFFIVK